MKEQYYYANLPTKLMREKFKNKEDRNLHLLAMTIITSWVNTQTGQFYLSVRKFAEELECSEKKARRVINNLIRWGYIRKISDSPNQYGQSIYELSTYNFDIEKGTPKDTPKDTAKGTAKSAEIQYSERFLDTPKDTPKDTATDAQINNELTNNEITNNEEEYIEEKSSLIDSNFEEIADIESQDALYNAYLETFNHICPEKRIIAITPERILALEKAQEILTKAGIEWKEACEKFKESEWIYSKRYATFDWFVKPDNLVKVLEGRFIDTAEENDMIEKPYSLTAINRLKNHPLTKEHYETIDLLNLLRRYYKRHSGDTVYIEAPHTVHLQIENIFQDLSIYFEDEGVVSCN